MEPGCVRLIAGRGDFQPLDAEVLAGGEQAAFGDARAGMRFKPGHVHGLVQMQLARPAIVVQPVGDGVVLLDLAYHQAGAQRVNRSGGDEVDLARFGWEPAQQVFNFPRKRGLARALRCDGLAEAGRQSGPGRGAQHVPHLGLAAASLVRLSVGVAGMHLHREPLGGEDEFHQDGQRLGAGNREPDLSRLPGPRAKPRLQVGDTPNRFVILGRQ